MGTTGPSRQQRRFNRTGIRNLIYSAYVSSAGNRRWQVARNPRHHCGRHHQHKSVVCRSELSRNSSSPAQLHPAEGTRCFGAGDVLAGPASNLRVHPQPRMSEIGKQLVIANSLTKPLADATIASLDQANADLVLARAALVADISRAQQPWDGKP
jgi:hypothetical protein